jgi:hypothetical protein
VHVLGDRFVSLPFPTKLFRTELNVEDFNYSCSASDGLN